MSSYGCHFLDCKISMLYTLCHVFWRFREGGVSQYVPEILYRDKPYIEELMTSRYNGFANSSRYEEMQ